MGLFSKKNNEYDNASKELNGAATSKATDRIVMEQILDDDDRATELVDMLKNGCPLIINFEKLSTMAVNKLLAFLSGACYALDGNTVKIKEFTYLFARKVEFLDGSLSDFIDKI